jgi:hypothetical protein
MTGKNITNLINKFKLDEINSPESQKKEAVKILLHFYRHIKNVLETNENLKSSGLTFFFQEGIAKVTDIKLGIYEAPTLKISVTHHNTSRVVITPIESDLVFMVGTNGRIPFYFFGDKWVKLKSNPNPYDYLISCWHTAATVGLFKPFDEIEFIEELLGVIVNEN